MPDVPPQNNLRKQLEELGQKECWELLKKCDPKLTKKINFADQIRTIRALEVYYATGKPLSTQQIQKPFKIYYNTQKHQQNDSECGMFSMYFIIKMLEGMTFHKLNEQRISDEDVFKFRYVFFHPNEQTNTNQVNIHNLLKQADNDNDAESLSFKKKGKKAAIPPPL